MNTEIGNKSITITNILMSTSSKLSGLIIREIQEIFKSHGYNVTEEAINHQYISWSGDFKSGYVDEENGYFLFSPCGCNPFEIWLEKYTGEDYQKTYEC